GSATSSSRPCQQLWTGQDRMTIATLFADRNARPGLANEAAGAVGNFGTVLPLLFGVVLATGIAPGPALLFFGLWYIAAGLVYRLPIPIEPMKTVAVVAIAGQATAGEVVAGGILLGALFLVLGLSGWIDPIVARIPVPVTRGVQLGLALLLARSAVVYGIGDPVLAVAGLAIVGAFVLLRRRWALPDLSALLILVLGVALGVIAGGVPAPAVPLPYPVLPAAGDWLPALLVLVLPQAVLTLTNSIAATELLARDLLPRPPTAGLLSRMIGAMNLVSVPLGGIPMCHGAGGLAAQYRFGGRTGVSNAIAGLVLVAIAFFASSEGAVALFPTGLLAALLLVVALEMARAGLRTDAPVPTVVVALVSLVTSLTVGFVAGWLVLWALARWRPRRPKFSELV
ncbi:MAG TPA: putative sulfate/molybdate transporter, partial [Methanoregulaceae archaeon]|nr:putative sulfate/molybdate transporter [Methanoregulaceae archaeon]